MSLHVSLQGVTQTLSAMGRRKVKATRTTEDVLDQCGQIILKLALTYVPVKTGRLRDTGKSKVTGRGGGSEVKVTFGGTGAPYGLYVHENPLMRHAPPTMYKFLSRAVAGTKGTRSALVKRSLLTTLQE